MKKRARLLFLFLLFIQGISLDAQWVRTNGPYCSSVLSLAVSGTNLFAGTENGGVFLSTNNGTSWTPVNSGLTNTYVLSLGVSGTNLIAGTAMGGIYLSTNNGTSWTPVNLGLTTSGGFWSFAVSGTNIFAGSFGGSVFLSTNNGTSWTSVSEDLPGRIVSALVVSGKNLFAGTVWGGVWRRPLSEMVTSVERTSMDLPAQFSLGQNHPNPFNPSTTISFSVPSKLFVSLKVFDALGREVSNLVAEELPAGTYTRHWDAAALPSGVYFYRLQAGEYLETNRMVVLK